MMNKDFYEVKNVWSLFFKGSSAYQLIRKLWFLKNLIKTFKKQYDDNPDITMHKLASV